MPLLLLTAALKRTYDISLMDLTHSQIRLLGLLPGRHPILTPELLGSPRYSFRSVRSSLGDRPQWQEKLLQISLFMDQQEGYTGAVAFSIQEDSSQ